MGGAVVDEGPTGIKAPDGGWGWAVLFGCFVITGFSYAFPKAVSVFFKELMREFGIGYSDTAWISSILLAMLYGTGPLCSVCVNRFGCRPVMLTGGLLASLGMVAASFCRSVIQLYLTTGVITGLGLALNFQPSLIMLNRYFNKRRPMANGLAAAGSPVFLCALSPLGQLLQDRYGWRGGFLILGGLLLNCCVCAALMRPLRAPGPVPGPAPQRPPRRLLDLSVFRDRGFVIYAVAASIMVLGLFVPPVFVVSYAKDLGVPDGQAAFLLTVLGFIDIFARPTAGFITGLEKVRPYSVYLFSFSMFFNGFTDLTGSTASDYGGLVVFCIFFGISYGMVGALQFEVLMAIVGTQKFSSAIGLVLLLEAVAVLIGPPSGGGCWDAGVSEPAGGGGAHHWRALCCRDPAGEQQVSGANPGRARLPGQRLPCRGIPRAVPLHLGQPRAEVGVGFGYVGLLLFFVKAEKILGCRLGRHPGLGLSSRLCRPPPMGPRERHCPGALLGP
uniref:Solute carrier family 16 member 3 n=2 Tax=Neovison vison TaxID=452646 RepID=A0A8C7ET99_NEOVI